MTELSIIIPHYNSVDLLTELLDTIPIYPELEVIVIDDKSNEGIDQFRGLSASYPHVTFLENTSQKKGAGVCRNIGLSQARGNWILFADADDLFTDQFFETLKPYLKSDYDVVFFPPTSSDIQGGEEAERHRSFVNTLTKYQESPTRTHELHLRYRISSPWSKLMRRKLIEAHHIIFDEVIAGNDVMFSATVGHYMQGFFISEKPIYCIRKAEGSITRTYHEANFNARLEVYIRKYLFLKKQLSRKDFKELDLRGKSILFKVFKYQLGYKKFISTFLKLKKNNIVIFDKQFLNPLILLKKALKAIHTNKSDLT